eukprot:gene13071-15439_t
MQNSFGILLLVRHVKSDGCVERVGSSVVKDICHDIHEKVLVEYGPCNSSEWFSWHDIVKLKRQKKLKLGMYIRKNGSTNALDGGVSRVRKIQDSMVEREGLYLWVIPTAGRYSFLIGKLTRVYTDFTHVTFRMVCNLPRRAESVVERSIDLTSDHGHFMMHQDCFDFYQLTAFELDEAIETRSRMQPSHDDAHWQSQACPSRPASASTSDDPPGIDYDKLSDLLDNASDGEISDNEGGKDLKRQVLRAKKEQVTDDEDVNVQIMSKDVLDAQEDVHNVTSDAFIDDGNYLKIQDDELTDEEDVHVQIMLKDVLDAKEDEHN